MSVFASVAHNDIMELYKFRIIIIIIIIIFVCTKTPPSDTEG